MTGVKRGAEGVRAEAKFFSNFKLIWVVQMAAQKYFALSEYEYSVELNPSRARRRDVSPSSRYVGRRMRWTLASSTANGSAAYGKVVWSWRRDPGATLARSIAPANGGKKGRFPGEITKETVKPLRGESRDVSVVPVVLPPCALLYAHGTTGAASARLSLRPLQGRGTTRLQNSGRSCRGNADVRLQRCLKFEPENASELPLILPWRGRVDANEMSGGVG